MRLLVLIVAIMLTGCAAIPHEDQNFTAAIGSDTVTIRWDRLSKIDLQKKCSSLTKKELNYHMEYLGCATFNKKYCIIYTDVNTTHQILGHEVRHCFYGDFHK
jgi:hypothetical protein